MTLFHNYLEFVTEFREVPLAGSRNKAPPFSRILQNTDKGMTVFES